MAAPKPVGTGLTVGFLTGLFGVGGGFLVVPALVLLLGLPMTTAVGTSLVVIVLNSAPASPPTTAARTCRCRGPARPPSAR